MRIDKYLAHSTGMSRSQLKKMIKDGAVAKNGCVVKDAGEHVGDNDTVTVDGKAVAFEEFVYLMLNKPAGVVSATTDARQKTVLDLLPDTYKKAGLFPVGRLDVDTEGLLILTNDGQAAHRALAPNKKVPKTYYVETDLPIPASVAEAFSAGVDIGGYTTKPAQLIILAETSAHLTITEGKFHQVKRMFASQNNRVKYLRRISFAGIDLDGALSPGEFRPLTDDERAHL